MSFSLRTIPKIFVFSMGLCENESEKDMRSVFDSSFENRKIMQAKGRGDGGGVKTPNKHIYFIYK